MVACFSPTFVSPNQELCNNKLSRKTLVPSTLNRCVEFTRFSAERSVAVVHELMLMWLSVVLVGVVLSNLVNWVSVAGQDLPTYQIEALSALYNSTNGQSWQWKLPYSTYGQPWDFSGSNLTGTLICSTWQGIACLPSDCSAPCVITNMSLSGYGMAGSISNNVSSLNTLLSLDLSNNQLVGTIPGAWVQNWTQLLYVSLQGNGLTGSIPAEIAYATQLEVLDLSLNKLRGTLPSGIGQLEQLRAFDLSSNQLFGPLPDEVSSWRRVQRVNISVNSFDGTLSLKIDKWESLEEFYIYNNRFSGEIPTTVAALPALRVFYGANNYFTGTLPTFPSVQALSIDNNLFTGRFPSTLLESDGLNVLSLSGNFFSYSLPDKFPASWQYISLSDNLFTSTIPSSLLQNNKNALSYFDLSGNYMSGTLPSYLFSSAVSTLLIGNNVYSGALPEVSNTYTFNGSIYENKLQYLDLAVSRISGSLPKSFANVSTLTTFILSHAQLSGDIIGVFSAQKNLSEVVLNNNYLTGPVDDIFASSTANNWVLNIAYNQFTGTWSEAQLSSGQWQALIGSVNCLSNLINDGLCTSTNLTELLLDGVHTAPTCRTPISVPSILDPLVQDTTYVDVGTQQRFPSCLLGLPSLQHLHLSGSRLTGSLGESLGASLIDLELSHNQLTGTIPAAVWQRSFTTLDLSFNRLSGTVSADACSCFTSRDSSLTLQVNQLSGTLPSAWTDVATINVLSGNMFACAHHSGLWLETANLPVNDPNADTYQCGSVYTNVALFVAFLLSCSACIVAVYLAPQTKSVVDAVRRFWGTPGDRRFVQCVAGLLVFEIVALSLYAGLSAANSQYAVQYVWVISLSLQQGRTAAGVLCFWLLIVMAAVFVTRGIVLNGSSQSEGGPSRSSGSISGVLPSEDAAQPTSITTLLMTTFTQWRDRARTTSWVSVAILFLLSALSITVAIFANGLYVYAIGLNLSGTQTTLVVLTLAAFKLLWSHGLNTVLLKVPHWLPHIAQLSRGMAWAAPPVTLLLGLTVCNNILAPLVAELLVSENCFYYVFRAPPLVTSSVADGYCYWITYYAPTALSGALESAFPCGDLAQINAAYNGEDFVTMNHGMTVLSSSVNNQGAVVSYQPGFVLTYQCSASLQQSFMYVFVYRFIMSAFFMPVWWILMKSLQEYVLRSGDLSSEQTRKRVDRRSRLVPVLWRPWHIRPLLDENNVETVEELNIQLRILQRMVDTKAVASTGPALRLRIGSDLAIIWCFGVLFPPLALLAALSLLIDVAFSAFLVDRLHTLHVNAESYAPQAADGNQDDNRVVGLQGRRLQLLRTLVEEVSVGWTTLTSQIAADIPIGLLCATIVWGFTVVDILADNASSAATACIFVFIVGAPLWMPVVVSLVQTALRRRSMVKDDTPPEDRMTEITTQQNPLQQSGVSRGNARDEGLQKTADEHGDRTSEA